MNCFEVKVRKFLYSDGEIKNETKVKSRKRFYSNSWKRELLDVMFQIISKYRQWFGAIFRDRADVRDKML